MLSAILLGAKILFLQLSNAYDIFQYFVAITIPIDLPGRQVFVSYNFEINYAETTKAEQFTSGWYTKV